MVKQYFTIWSYKNLLHRITVNKSFSPCFHVQVSQKLSMSVLALIQLDWTGEFPTASNKTVDKKIHLLSFMMHAFAYRFASCAKQLKTKFSFTVWLQGTLCILIIQILILPLFWYFIYKLKKTDYQYLLPVLYQYGFLNK